jgi:hypothetical protein
MGMGRVCRWWVLHTSVDRIRHRSIRQFIVNRAGGRRERVAGVRTQAHAGREVYEHVIRVMYGQCDKTYHNLGILLREDSHLEELWRGFWFLCLLHRLGDW